VPADVNDVVDDVIKSIGELYHQLSSLARVTLEQRGIYHSVALYYIYCNLNIFRLQRYFHTDDAKIIMQMLMRVDSYLKKNNCDVNTCWVEFDG
jgi:hypothetical protein